MEGELNNVWYRIELDMVLELRSVWYKKELNMLLELQCLVVQDRTEHGAEITATTQYVNTKDICELFSNKTHVLMAERNVRLWSFVCAGGVQCSGGSMTL